MEPSAGIAMASLCCSPAVVKGAKESPATRAGSGPRAAGEWDRSAAFSLRVAGRDCRRPAIWSRAVSPGDKLNRSARSNPASLVQGEFSPQAAPAVAFPDLNLQRARKSSGGQTKKPSQNRSYGIYFLPL
jgi:hypothetical protein